MARKNKLGTSFLGLDLTPEEEARLKADSKKLNISAKAFIRYLIRIHQQNENK
jgi:hypothetical protein